MNVRLGILSVFCAVLASCASKSVLEEVKQETGAPTTAPTELTVSANYQKLKAMLDAEGYSGVGLEYESEATLTFLIQVFSDPRTKNRQIKLLYTGLNLTYDPRYQSLTIGGTRVVETILAYIQKNVPARPRVEKQ